MYIAGPITLGDIDANVQRAVTVGQVLLDKGYAPFIPHLSHFMEPASTWDKNPTRYERWLELDFSYISVCHALLRLLGESKGADREVKWARKLGIPVFHTLDDLLACMAKTSPLTLSWPA